MGRFMRWLIPDMALRWRARYDRHPALLSDSDLIARFTYAPRWAAKAYDTAGAVWAHSQFVGAAEELKRRGIPEPA